MIGSFLTVYAAYGLSLATAAVAVPLSRSGARRTLWIAWALLAIALPFVAAGAMADLVAPRAWPMWRFVVGYILVLSIPSGIAVHTADRLARRQPVPRHGRHVALVAGALIASIAVASVISRPLFPQFSAVHAEQ